MDGYRAVTSTWKEANLRLLDLEVEVGRQRWPFDNWVVLARWKCEQVISCYGWSFKGNWNFLNSYKTFSKSASRQLSSQNTFETVC
jgi:hypothetical protein